MRCCLLSVHAMQKGLVLCQPAMLTVVAILYKACTVCRPQPCSSWCQSVIFCMYSCKKFACMCGSTCGLLTSTISACATFVAARLAHALENGTCLAGRSADPFAVRNRMSLPGSLHRISAMKGDQEEIQGLTYRIGRHISDQHFPFL